jgi:hypothetical protein
VGAVVIKIFILEIDILRCPFRDSSGVVRISSHTTEHTNLEHGSAPVIHV